MNKQVEQIKAEIERLKAIADYQLENYKVDRSAWNLLAEVCKKLLSFIGSDLEPDLTHSVTKMSDQEEPANDFVLGGTKSNKSLVIHPESIPHDKKPVDEDLEVEIKNIQKGWKSLGHNYDVVTESIARHFVKWQKDKDKLIFYNDLSEFADIKKLVVNEIASINTIEAIDTDFDGWYNRLIVFAKRCAQWQKQQMVKESVSGYVYSYVSHEPYENVIKTDAIKGMEHLTPLKIIIIKEDKI